MIEVKVRHNNIETALRIFKRKIKDDGLFMEIKRNEFYKKPSEIKKQKEGLGKVRSWLKQKELNPDWCGDPPTRSMKEKFRREQNLNRHK